MAPAQPRIDVVRHLQFFVAVAEELHFGRAAAVVGVSQPPLSQGVQRLERRLGLALFDRNSGGVRLTSAGVALLPRAKAILAEVESLLSFAAATGQSPVGLRLGVAPQLRTATVAALVGAARSAVDGRVEVLTAPSARLLVDTAEARLDVAVITHPAALAAVRGGPVARSPGRLLIAADHVLAQRCSPVIDLRHVAPTLPVALPPREHHPAVHDQMLDVMARYGVRLSPRRVEDDRSAVLVAAAGVAAAWTTDAGLTSTAVVNLAIEGDPLPLRQRLVYALEPDGAPEAAVIGALQRVLDGGPR